jgi:DNA-binding NarL/FixJ family response regulator
MGTSRRFGWSQMNTASRLTSPAKPIRVLLADDHVMVRTGIRALLEQLPQVTVIGEARDGREALEMMKAHQPDVVLLDISMPGLNGLQALARMNKDFPQVRVIILSEKDEDEYVWQALKSGASGYVHKGAPATELQTALDSALHGKTYISREISSRFKNFGLDQMAHSSSPLQQLTGRQLEILQLLAESHNTKDIALILKISDKTVEYHRAKLMARLNIFDVPGLTRFALRNKMIRDGNLESTETSRSDTLPPPDSKG